jgi:regulator of protease activity HflC (stomatin/prohibitin superfamily)
MFINPDQKAIIIRKGAIRKVVSDGNAARLPGLIIEVSDIYNKIEPKRIALEQALQNDVLKKEIELFEIPDGRIGLHFENEAFKDVLGPGKHAYWKSIIAHKVIVIDLSEPRVDPAIGRFILMKPEVKEYLAGYSIEPYQKGLLFIDNAFSAVLEPGNYFYWKGTKSVSVHKIDMRLQQIEVSGQEIMTRDKIPVRVNFFCQYKVEDVMTVYLNIAEYEKQFYILLQLALREYIGSLLLDEILGKKTEVEQFVNAAVAAKARELGLTVTGSGIKDIILPGDIKEIINQVLIAEKKAQANVIMRREETASTRSLLNTAKLMDENKTLYQLKELEYIERISEKINQLSVNGNGTQVLEELKRLFLPK